MIARPLLLRHDASTPTVHFAAIVGAIPRRSELFIRAYFTVIHVKKRRKTNSGHTYVRLEFRAVKLDSVPLSINRAAELTFPRFIVNRENLLARDKRRKVCVSGATAITAIERRLSFIIAIDN